MNKKLKHIGFIIVMVSLLITTGCNNKKDNNNEQGNITETDNGVTDTITTTPTDIPTEVPTNIEGESDNKAKDETQQKSDINVEPVVTKEVNIYTMNETTFNVESAVALIPIDTELTPEIIVDMVVDSFADRLVAIGIDSVTTKGDTVIVSFLNDSAPIFNTGSGLESTILDAIAQSLVDNLEEYPKVIFRAEGEAYATGHNEFGIDEVYLDNNSTH